MSTYTTSLRDPTSTSRLTEQHLEIGENNLGTFNQRMLLSRVLPKPASIFRASQPRTLRLSQTVTASTAPPTFQIRNPLLQTSIMSIHMNGHCVCKNLQYSLELDSLDDARTTLCHCNSCKRAFGTNYGLTTKVPLKGFKYETGTPKLFKQHNGVTREFCDNCGAYICEYGVSSVSSTVCRLDIHTHAFTGRGSRQVPVHHVGVLQRAGKGASQGRVLLQEQAQMDARYPRYGSRG